MTGWIPTTSLPAGAYGWRVQRLDVDSRPGPWSADDERRATPLHRGRQPGHPPDPGQRRQLRRTTTRASRGRPLRAPRSTGSSRRPTSDFSGTLTESVVTVMTSWHSTKVYPNGTYFWRVQTIDGAGNVTATSAVRSFTHGPPPPPPTYYQPITPEPDPGQPPGHRASGPYSTQWAPNESRIVTVAGLGGSRRRRGRRVERHRHEHERQRASSRSGRTVSRDHHLEPSTGRRGDTIANAVTVKVGDGNQVTSRTRPTGSPHVILDVVGYYTDAARCRLHRASPRSGSSTRGRAPSPSAPTTPSGGPAPPARCRSRRGGHRRAGRRRRRRAQRHGHRPHGGLVPDDLARGRDAAHRVEPELQGGRVARRTP